MPSADEPIVAWVSEPEPVATRVADLERIELHAWAGEPELPASADRVEYVALPIGPPATVWESLRRLPRLRTVQLVTAGYESALGRLPDGVALSNGRGIHDPAVAEWVMAVTLSTVRSLPELRRRQETRTWDAWFSRSLFESTVLIVGYGSIGRAVERLLAPFDPTILRVSRNAHDGTSAVADLPALIGRADVVIVLLPDSAETRGLFDRDLLSRMKDGALLVNAGRGSAVVTDALVAELRSGRIRAALDVTEVEPLPADSPLWSAPGVIITPHIASNAEGKDERIQRFVAAQLRRLATGIPLENPVDQ